ncbi:MAG: hypothetical protein ACK559_33270, partial [bacterium]
MHMARAQLELALELDVEPAVALPHRGPHRGAPARGRAELPQLHGGVLARVQQPAQVIGVDARPPGDVEHLQHPLPGGGIGPPGAGERVC